MDMLTKYKPNKSFIKSLKKEDTKIRLLKLGLSSHGNRNELHMRLINYYYKDENPIDKVSIKNIKYKIINIQEIIFKNSKIGICPLTLNVYEYINNTNKWVFINKKWNIYNNSIES